MDLINDIRFDLATAYINEHGTDGVAHRVLGRDNARTLIEKLEQVYAQITTSQEADENVGGSAEIASIQAGTH